MISAEKASRVITFFKKNEDESVGIDSLRQLAKSNVNIQVPSPELSEGAKDVIEEPALPKKPKLAEQPIEKKRRTKNSSHKK